MQTIRLISLWVVCLLAFSASACGVSSEDGSSSVETSQELQFPDQSSEDLDLLAGVCRGGPNNGATCNSDLTCGKFCQAGPFANLSCASNAACGKFCQAGPFANLSCASNAACGKFCQAGSRANAFCTFNSDCPGSFCASTFCLSTFCLQSTCR
jgi:hypothetical protein